MKKQINQIREFIWPLLEPIGKSEGQIALEPPIINIEEENIELAFDLKIKIINNEEDRRKGIESKAALFLSTISIASSLIIAANSVITGKVEISLMIRFSILVSFVLSLYAIRTVWYSIKALERKSFKIICFPDFNIKGSKSEYQKSIIIKMNEYTKYNQLITNEKIDFLTMAQEYYKRAIVIICLYTFLICIYSFC